MPQLEVYAALDAELPPPLVGPTTECVERNAIVTTIDANGLTICDRLYPVIIDESLEAPPSPDGKESWWQGELVVAHVSA